MATYNDSYRGYLQQQADSGNALAKLGLDFQGDDGGINPNALESYYDSPTGDRSAERDSTANQLRSLYNGYAGSGVLGDSTSTSNATGGGADTAGELASLDRTEGRLRGLYGQADTDLNNGLTQLGDSVTQKQNELNTARTRALENYDLQGQEATGKRDTGLEKVGTNARTLNDSLRRLLGLAAGSDSTAFQYAAPGAVAREASQGRQGVIKDYSTDFGALEKAKKNAGEDYQGAIDSLLADKGQRESALRSGILGQKQQIDSQLGDIAARRSGLKGAGTAAQIAAAQGYENQYNDRQTAINNLFNQFRQPVTARAVNPEAVNLSQYAVDKAGINAQRQTGQDTGTGIYSNLLRKQLEEQQA